LNHARAALDLGDRASALAAVNAALAIDPDYLAAQALKDRIERSPDIPPPAAQSVPTASAWTDPVRPEASQDAPVVSPDRRPVLPPQPPVVSAEGWARFEHRARTRRLERRGAAARLAITRRRFDEARAILQEIGEIDSGHPELISLGIELDAEEHLALAHRRRWGPAVAAVLILAGVISGARYLQSPGWSSAVLVPAQPASETPTNSAAVAAPTSSESAAAATQAIDTAAATAGHADLAPASIPPETGHAVQPPHIPASTLEQPSTAAVPAPLPLRPAAGTVDLAEARPDAPSSPARNAVPTPTSGRIEWPPVMPAALPPPPPPGPAFTTSSPSPAPAVTTAALPGDIAPEPSAAISPAVVARDPDVERARSAAAAVINAPRDEDLVRRTLQQYRAAYESLDAHSAQVVWPRVDEPALQRAFSGLESQRLTFDDCDVQVRGATGLATCRGTMLYVPKVGSRDPRREPRVWTFDLRKVGENWQIDNARTAR